MPTRTTKPHSVVNVKMRDGETVVAVCENGSAHYYDWENMTWVSMGMLPDTELYHRYDQPAKRKGTTKPN